MAYHVRNIEVIKINDRIFVFFVAKPNIKLDVNNWLSLVESEYKSSLKLSVKVGTFPGK